MTTPALYRPVATSAILLLPACTLLIDTTPNGITWSSAGAGQSGRISNGESARALPATENRAGADAGRHSSDNVAGATNIGGSTLLGGATSATSNGSEGGTRIGTAAPSSVENGGTTSTIDGSKASGGKAASGGTTTGVSASGMGSGGVAMGGASSGRPLTTTTPRVKSIALGGSHACALLSDETVKCWGWNSHGELGDGGIIPSSTPVAVVGLNGAKEISAGLQYTCALLTDGAVKCWGRNGGVLGDGTDVDRHGPVAVSNLSTVVRLSAGYGSTCAVVQDGSAYCWGSNGFGGLGNGRIGEDSLVPVKVSGSETYIGISASYQACAITSIYELWCWGMNSDGELGDGTMQDRASPVYTMSSASSVAAGFGHTCAVARDRTVACWGRNDLGQLGDGSTTSSTKHVTVLGVSNVAMIDTSSGHTCALADTAVYCWGDNLVGQLGAALAADFSSKPVAVKNLGPAASIGVGSGFACALLIDGSVHCWGQNTDGQLGDGTTVSSSTPVKVTGL